MKRLVFSFAVLMLAVSTAWAGGLRIDKPKIRAVIAAGGYESGEIKVENTSRDPMTVRVYLEDWVYSDQAGAKAFMPKGTAPLSCANWITFNPADFTLAPNASQIVRYTVAVPEGPRGGHYAVMFFETGGGNTEGIDEKGNNITIKILNRLGALFYIEPEGTIQKTAELKNVTVSQNKNNLTVRADFLNTGNTDINGRGSFNILDDQGYVYARGSFDEFYTLPNDKAVLESLVPMTNLKPGGYDMLLTLEYENNSGTLVREATFQINPDGSAGNIKLKE